MIWEQIYQNTFIPELPKIWNRNFKAFQNSIDVFYDASRGIIIKPIVTTGRVKAATGEFVTLIVDNLIVKNTSNISGDTADSSTSSYPTDILTLSEGLILDSSLANYIYKADVSINNNEGDIVPSFTISGAKNIYPATNVTGPSYYAYSSSGSGSGSGSSSSYYTSSYDKLSTGGTLILKGGDTAEALNWERGQGGDVIIKAGTVPGAEDNFRYWGDVLIKGSTIALDSDQITVSGDFVSNYDNDRIISLGGEYSDSIIITNTDYKTEISAYGIIFNEDSITKGNFQINGGNTQDIFKINSNYNRIWMGHSLFWEQNDSTFDKYHSQVVNMESTTSWGSNGEGLADSIRNIDALNLKNTKLGTGIGNIGGSLSLSGPNNIVNNSSIRQSVIAGKQTGSLQNEVGIAMFTHNDASTNLVESFVLDHQSNLTILGTYYPSSDIRLKSELEIIENPLDKIKKLTGYTFNKGGTRQAGLIANDVLEVLPEAIQIDNSKEAYLHLNDSAVTGLLVEALKEQQKLIEAQGKLIEELQLKIK